MSKRKPPSEKQQFRTQIESIKGETRKLQEKYVMGNEELKQFAIQQEKLLSYINEVNKQKKLFEEQMQSVRQNEETEFEEIEKEIQRIDIASQEKILCSLQFQSHYTQLAEDTRSEIRQFEREINQKIQRYDKTIKQRTAQIHELVKNLKELEDKEYQLLMNASCVSKPSNDQAFPFDSHIELGNQKLSHEHEVVLKQIDVLTKFKENLTAQITDLQKRCAELKIDYSPD